MPPKRAISALPRHLALAYGLLIVYACLHPFTGWAVSGLPPLDYLTAPWPRYYSKLDLAFNVLGYLPLGFVLAPALPAHWRRGWAVVTATAVAALLSFGLETVQNFLPSRIASNLDLGTNIAGGFIGAMLGARWGHALFDERGWLHRWRSQRIVEGHMGDAGLILLGLWLLTQLTASELLYGNGDLRGLLGLPAPVAFLPQRFIHLDAALTATTVITLGLLAGCIMRSPSPWPILLLLALGLGAKTVATATFFVPGEPLGWFTPGARQGLAVGLPLLGAALLLPRIAQHALAGVGLLAATALINLMPENPYLPLLNHTLVNQGNFLNFHGLTRLVAALWPFLALAYLSALGLWRGDHLIPATAASRSKAP